MSGELHAEDSRADYTLDVITSHLRSQWPMVAIEEVAEFNPRVDKAAIPNDMPVSFVPMAAVGAGDGSIQVDETRFAGEVKKGFTAFLEGDVLFAKITPCMENGKMAVAPSLINGVGFGSTEFHVLRPKPGMDAKYLYYYVSSQTFRREAERHMTGAVGQRRVPTAYLKECKIPVAPLDQQKRIVAEIEKQFSRLDEAVAGLKRVRANLKRYQDAVLKAAVEGRLVETEAELARRERRSYESGQKLLQRILEIRRSQWKGKGKYKEPTTPDTADLPALPAGWVCATLDQLTSKITSGSRDWSQYYGRGTGIFVLAQNVRPITPDFSAQQFVDPPSSDQSCDRSRIQDGDLLATIVGANAGQVCLVDTAPSNAYVCQSVALIRPVLLGTGAHLNYWLNSAENGKRYLEQCMYGQGRPHLSFEQLIVAPIALPPLAEQHRIVAEIDRRLSLLRNIENYVDDNFRRARRLRISVLNKLFSNGI